MTMKTSKRVSIVLATTLLLLFSSALSISAEKKTWKALDEMGEEELKKWKIDTRWSYEIQRHKDFNYLPEDIYPFEPPFSG